MMWFRVFGNERRELSMQEFIAEYLGSSAK